MLTYKNVRLAHALLSVAAIIGFFIYGQVFLYLMFALALLYLLIVAYGVFFVRASFFMKLYTEVPKHSKKLIALTFDDGPGEYTVKVLDLLKTYDIKATFFLIGERIATRQEIVQRLVSEGHQIGNHTFHHSKATGFFSADQLERELQSTKDLVHDIVGFEMKLFRPPFGVTTPNLAKVVSRLKLSTIGWSVRSFDTTSRSVASIIDRILNQVTPGAVVLMHDDREKCQLVLETLIPRLLEQHYHFVTVGELFQLEAYEKH
jgi:peptidoglycan/xylan/chitin deacetylase (PgdA/CDA1 family)